MVELCKNWLKVIINLKNLDFTDEKKFIFDGPDNWFSYHKNKKKLKKWVWMTEEMYKSHLITNNV